MVQAGDFGVCFGSQFGAALSDAEWRNSGGQIQAFTVGWRLGLGGVATGISLATRLATVLLVYGGLDLIGAGHGLFHFQFVRGSGIFLPILPLANLLRLVHLLLPLNRRRLDDRTRDGIDLTHVS
jgi:hypothetical protein